MSKRIEISSNQRPFVMIYWDFIECDLFDWYEKRIFIILKKFADSNNQCFPSIATLCKLSQLSKNTVRKTLKNLEEKKAISIAQRKCKENKEYQSNLYTLHDFPELWNAESIEQITETVDIDELRLFELAKKKGYRLEKEKEPGTTAPTKEPVEPSTKNDRYPDLNNTAQTEKSQDRERYTLEQIHQLFDYDIMLHDYPSQQQDIDTVMSILHTTI